MSRPPARSIALAAAVLGLAAPASADVVELPAEQDTTLYEDPAGALANGAGMHLFAGRTDNGEIRRGLVQFDVNAAIPPGSSIDSVTLQLYMSRSKAGPEPVSLHFVLADWGEGSSDADGEEGGGAASASGDATWIHTSYPSSFWASPGGDYVTSASASSIVDKEGVYTWSSVALLNDVQTWVDNPGTNAGWAVLGTESSNKTSKRFDTRENPEVARQPVLIVEFTPSDPIGACCFEDGTCTAATAAECAALGGTYSGDGTTCFPNPCTTPTGACCLGDSTCVEVSETECANLGGTFRGDGSSCALVDCPLVLEPYVDPLPIPAVATPVSGFPGGAASYEIRMRQVQQQMHRDLPPTTVWAYGDSTPGPVIEAFRGQPVEVTWINDLRDGNGNLLTQHHLPVDTCLHGPDMFGDAPRTVVHLHGGKVPPEVDGYPEDTLLPGESAVFQYPNDQDPALIWFHDHALGITRLNVYMGLAGAYVIRDQAELDLGLPAGEFEVPLVIQDRSFAPDGSLVYPAQWQDHFFGDHVVVNGKVSPYHEVRRGKYRVRALNGCNSRTLTLALSDGSTFHQIGTDGGLLEAPVALTEVTLSPGERADLVLDFEGYSPNDTVELVNSAPAPFPGPAGVGVVSEVVQFRVIGGQAFTDPLPTALTTLEVLQEVDAVKHRDFVLDKVSDPCTGSRWEIDGLLWDDVTEYPQLGSTEVWSWVNDSGVVHPMHMHLVFFQVLDRQPFDIVDGDVVPTGPPVPPAPNERGWKDTVQATPNEITRVIMRFEGYTGRYPYHCHVLEHEDHEMMRQFEVVLGPDVVIYGCGVNPADSLVHLGGQPSVGQAVTLGVDNPLGTQAAGSIAILGVSGARDPAWPPCGTSVPGFGMAGSGSPGEFLVSTNPAAFVTYYLGVWQGPGVPVPFVLSIPPKPSLIGVSVFAQGAVVDPTPGADPFFGLTDAAEIRIGE